MTLTLVPRACFEVHRVVVSGDTSALLVSCMSGEVPLWLDPMSASDLSSGAFHSPTFAGTSVQAGVPVVLIYEAGSTIVPLSVSIFSAPESCDDL